MPLLANRRAISARSIWAAIALIDWFKYKFPYWGAYWIPTVVIGGLSSAVRTTSPPTHNIQNVVVFLLEHIGDAVISDPFLRQLRSAFPTAQVTVVVYNGVAPLLEKHPSIDHFVTIPRCATWVAAMKQALRTARRLSALNADFTIVPKDARQDGFEELMAVITKSKWRLSLATPGLVARIKPLKLHLFYDELITTTGSRHESEYRASAITKYLPNSYEPKYPRIWLDDEERHFACEFLSDRGVDSKTLAIAFGIGASRLKRCWPLENYASVIDALSVELRIEPIIICGPDEIERAWRLATLTRCQIHIGNATTLRQCAALIEQCALFIGNDSGPMHIAAAVGVPVVEISCHPDTADHRSFNSPTRYGPFGVQRTILQPAAPLLPCCTHGCIFEGEPHCITQVHPQIVVDSALKLLAVAGNQPL